MALAVGFVLFKMRFLGFMAGGAEMLDHEAYYTMIRLVCHWCVRAHIKAEHVDFLSVVR